MEEPKRSRRRFPTGPGGSEAAAPFAGRCLAALQAIFEVAPQVIRLQRFLERLEAVQPSAA